jgi:hypothetical protein
MVRNGLNMFWFEKKGVVKGLALNLANTKAPLVLKTCHIVKYYMLKNPKHMFKT